MNHDLKLMLEAFRLGHEDRASRILREYLEKRVHLLITEDHEKYMTSGEMEKHVDMLYGKANDKDEFLSKLANLSKMDSCTAKDFRKCTNTLQGMGKKYMDKAIHSLEKFVGYEYVPVKEDLGNVITRPLPGVPDGGALIPNVYTTKKISKKKKKLPSLKKNVYGTGYAPGAWHGDHASDHPGTGGGEGGGDGGGGGE